MANQPFFDSEEGRNLFSKMLSGVEELRRLKALTQSTDPKVREDAMKKLHEILEKGKEFLEKAKEGNVEYLARLKELFQNDENMTVEQVQQKSELEHKLKKVFSDEKDTGSSKGKKKKFAKDKWQKS
ncbi:MAG: hypothetical protein EBU93_01470 [Chlamydiae bacterium]|jgi:hypothetical protein|nr:hypothetical protein [Chlamydiota bacterium]